MRTLTLLDIDFINLLSKLLSKLLKKKYKFELTLTFPIQLQSNLTEFINGNFIFYHIVDLIIKLNMLLGFSHLKIVVSLI